MSNQGPIRLESDSAPRASAPAPARPSCPKCSARLPAGATLCTNCGQDLRAPVQPGKKKPALTCRHCGYDVSGLARGKCPECGKPFSDNPMMQAAREEGDRAARRAYLQPAIMTAAGLTLGCLCLLFYGGAAAIPWWLASFVIKVPVGLAIYFACCAIWIGFDQPAGMASIQLMGIYAVVEGLMIATAPIGLGIIMPLALTCVYVWLLAKILDLETVDAVVVAISTNIALVVVGIVIAKAIA